MYSYFNHQLILIVIFSSFKFVEYCKEELEFQQPLNM